MHAPSNGAQRASSRHVGAMLVATLAAFVGLGTFAQPAAAADHRAKVVIVVGATHGHTPEYIRDANRVARQARRYGARVVKVYSPWATWSRVKQAARGANLFVYLGHGNGSPSPYGPLNRFSMNGLGLNERGGRGHNNTKYYGENFVDDLQFAPNSVVLFMRLCYAAGSSEWGQADPPAWKARRRVDNYGAGFLRAGARAVFAEGLYPTRYVLRGLFRTDMTMRQIFWSAPNAKRVHKISHWSHRNKWARAVLDPYKRRGSYYRSVVGKLWMSAAEWR